MKHENGVGSQNSTIFLFCLLNLYSSEWVHRKDAKIYIHVTNVTNPH